MLNFYFCYFDKIILLATNKIENNFFKRFSLIWFKIGKSIIKFRFSKRCSLCVYINDSLRCHAAASLWYARHQMKKQQIKYYCQILMLTNSISTFITWPRFQKNTPNITIFEFEKKNTKKTNICVTERM